MSYTRRYLKEVGEILSLIDGKKIEKIAGMLRRLAGQLFILGVGGSAANASHAVNDFRKLCGIEAYCPTDNVAELTARINDDGWESSFVNWLKVSRLNSKDMLLVLSVGGGTALRSFNIVEALRYGKEIGASIIGIVGKDGGATLRAADCTLLIPTVNPKTVTPHTEAFQSIVLHLLASHPLLKETL